MERTNFFDFFSSRTKRTLFKRSLLDFNLIILRYFRFERLMVKTQNKEARVAADQQALMLRALPEITVQDVQRTIHRLSCELFPRFVAGDEPESEAVLGGATSCPEFGAGRLVATYWLVIISLV
jgi:hypothetical protein